MTDLVFFLSLPHADDTPFGAPQQTIDEAADEARRRGESLRIVFAPPYSEIRKRSKRKDRT